MVDAYFDSYENEKSGLRAGNVMARTRMIVLYDQSAKIGGLVLGTGNKTEILLGYSTLYGDSACAMNPLADLYKTEVFELAGFINSDQEIIPENTIIKPPSAELRPDQKDSDSLPEYELLDRILYAYIEQRKGPEAIVKLGIDPHTVARVLRLVNMNEYKRYQSPPILRVSPKAFGMGRRLPIVARYLS